VLKAMCFCMFRKSEMDYVSGTYLILRISVWNETGQWWDVISCLKWVYHQLGRHVRSCRLTQYRLVGKARAPTMRLFA
jgi:hypothetical protein